MDEKPKRRWFRFRLSTVLILTAIVAWAMACWPYYKTWTTRVKVEEPASPPKGAVGGKVTFSFGRSQTSFYWVQHTTLNHRAIWPALALAAFLAWKTAWAVRECRRPRSAASE